MPGLLTLKTDLKSLKYGQDQPGGGSSRQPYITTDINTVDTDFNRLRLTKFDDGLIRGGIVGATNASIVDALRIGKFFLDAPKGPLFIVKQVGLQLSNPRLEIPKNPLNITTGFPSNALSVTTNGLLQPTRIYNLGINTLLQVPLNAFGGHLLRHGLFPIQSDASKYEAIVTANNDNFNLNDPSKNNRLVSLSRKFQLGDKEINRPTGQAANVLNQLLSAVTSFTGVSIPLLNKPIDTVIDDYIGGPGSVYGIGKTLIKRTSNTEDGFKINLAKQFSRDYAGKTRDNNGAPATIDYTSDLGLSKQYYSDPDLIELPKLDRATYSSVGNAIYFESSSINDGASGLRSAKTVPVKNASYQQYQNIINSKNLRATTLYVDDKEANQFGIYGDANENRGEGQIYTNILPTSLETPLYTNGNQIVKINLPWNKVTREIRVGSGRQDSINLTPLFRQDVGGDGLEVTLPNGTKYTINDLVKFRIQAIDTDTPSESVYMVFRAYLTDLSDDVSAEWTDIKYAGRGDKFYIYNGFTRKMSIGFKVAALSAVEMAPMYQKLNYLMSNLMPDYNNNLMRGPLVRMTVGNYVDNQLGILTSLNYKVSNETPWEIALNEPTVAGGIREMVLPHIIDVSLGFTPIGSQTWASNELSKKAPNVTHIAQNYNGKLETQSNYITPNDDV